MAAAVMTLEVARGRRGVWGGAILLAGGVLMHWMFATLFIALLGVVGLIQLVLRRGDTAEPRRLAIKRLAAMLALGVALGAGGLLLAPQRPGQLPGVDRAAQGPARKLEFRLPALALPITLPLAGLGSALLAFDRRRDRRNAGVLLGVWSSIAVVSLVAWFLLDVPLPPYRWAGFALTIPAAVVLGAFAAADRLDRSGRRGIALVSLSFGLVATVGLAGAGASVWWNRKPTLAADEFAQLRTFASYLEPLPLETRIVILLKAHRQQPPINRAWTMLPPERMPYVTMVAARIEPTAPDLGLSPAAWNQPGTVVVALDAYRKPRDVGLSLGPGVHLISGPLPRDVEVGVPPRAPPGIALAFQVAILLFVLLLTGGGWAALSDLPVLGIVSVAPAFGLAILSYAGLVASRWGVPLHGLGGGLLVSGIAIAGWVAAFLRRRHLDPAVVRNGEA
jgi:hypothetical protein